MTGEIVVRREDDVQEEAQPEPEEVLFDGAVSSKKKHGPKSDLHRNRRKHQNRIYNDNVAGS